MKQFHNKTYSGWALIFSVALILVGFLILADIYFPLLKEEGKYLVSKNKEKIIVTPGAKEFEKTKQEKVEKIVPVDLDFSLIVPKVSANAKVISNVDPNNSIEYQRALTKGVAHAEGTSVPGESGNVFIFAHSGLDLAEALKYNAVFYLLGKMENKDEIVLFYKGSEYRYAVTEKKIVGAEEVQYLKGDEKKKTITLMTCWPAGTTYKRMIVIGEQI